MDAQKKVRTILAAGGADLPPPKSFDGIPDGGRNIPAGFEYNPKALKPLARMLLSMSISLGHSLTAYREFTKLKSSNISPDGKVGGRGYVLAVKDVRAKLQQACELISSVSDTVYDEINAPHWKPKLADLGRNDAEDITEFLEESKKIMDDPEGYAEGELNEVEEENDGPGGSSNEEKSTRDPRFTSKSAPKRDDASTLPGGGAPEAQEHVRSKTAATEKEVLSRFLRSSSSLPVTTLPGPRVNHLGPGEGSGPWGSYNTEESGAEWGDSEGAGQNYLYPSDSRMGESGLPSDDTSTEGWDFGLGWGARGQGARSQGARSPGGQGVAGPNSGLPNSSGGPLANNHDPIAAAPWGMSALPNDGESPVARSDYFQGDRGNQFNVSHNGESSLPSAPQSPLQTDLGLSNVGEVSEDQAVPYVKWDWNTHNYRHDQQDIYSYDRTSDG